MADPTNGLTLVGLARLLRDHVSESAERLAEEREERRAQDAQLRAGIEDLRREIGTAASLIRDLGQVVSRHHDQLALQQREMEDHRQQIRQIFSRMEQHDARFEEMSREIRRILDAIERRGGDGGRRQE
jgi:chromosome segregation ATPase